MLWGDPPYRQLHHAAPSGNLGHNNSGEIVESSAPVVNKILESAGKEGAGKPTGSAKKALDSIVKETIRDNPSQRGVHRSFLKDVSDKDLETLVSQGYIGWKTAAGGVNNIVLRDKTVSAYKLNEKEDAARFDEFKAEVQTYDSDLLASHLEAYQGEFAGQMGIGKDFVKKILPQYISLIKTELAARLAKNEADDGKDTGGSSAVEKQAWEMTRTEYRQYENKKKLDAIVQAVKDGREIGFSTRMRAFKVFSPDTIRMTPGGEVQIQSGAKWINLLDDQLDYMARQSGMAIPGGEDKLYHGDMIATAMAEGKTIPENVIKDYRDWPGISWRIGIAEAKTFQPKFVKI